MKNDVYSALKRSAAKIYQKRTEQLALLKKTPEDKRSAETKYKMQWMKEALQNTHRNPGEMTGEGRDRVLIGRGFLSSLHDLVSRKRVGYMIPTKKED